MGSLDAKRMMIAATCGAMLLAGCGGGEGNPRPENGAGAGGSGASGGSGGSAGSAAGSAGMPVDACMGMRTEKTGGVINPVEEVGMEATDTEHRRFPTNDGGWYIYHASPDDTQCPTDTCMTTPPRDGHGAFELSPTMPARSGSVNALHVVGTGFPYTAYGGGIGMYLDCVSLSSAVTGVSFYYRSDIALQFGVTTGLPTGNHIVSVPAAEEWTQAMISFSMLTPEPPTTAPVDPTKFGAMFWRANVPTGTMTDWGFDVWIDDVAWIP